VTFEISASHVKFQVEGEVGNGSIVIKTSEEKVNDQAAITLSFALRYLNLFNKAYSLSNEVKIRMSQDAPLVVEFEIERMGALKFFLAPKISDEQG
jgi:proliferating cell nuclear antigen